MTGGGKNTTDLLLLLLLRVVDIYYSAGESLCAPIKQGILMDMMYMPERMAITLMGMIRQDRHTATLQYRREFPDLNDIS